MFKPYLHLEKFGNTEVEGIELGKTFIFPKIDGTNASVWMEDRQDGRGLCGGSRTRELSLEKDNAGFLAWIFSGKRKPFDGLYEFFIKYPHLRLYGEWLVPHSYTGYRQDAWKKFYVFDVYNDETEQYLAYPVYQPLLEEFKIEYIPPLAEIKNGSYEHFLKCLEQNFFLIPDGGQPGEGIVIKNYDYQNKFGRQCFAKLIRNEFKEMHAKAMGALYTQDNTMNEEKIVNKVITSHLVDKTYEKIRNSDSGWSKRSIPELFERVFYDLVKEELWDAWKDVDFATINGKTLKALTINKIKQLKPEIF